MITHDNDGEFAQHQAVTDAIRLRAFFCDPHSPWQRGSIENANGRLRRDLPRNTSLGGYTDADIDDVIWNLNATPRKRPSGLAPVWPDSQAGFFDARMNSRGERILSAECGWFSL